MAQQDIYIGAYGSNGTGGSTGMTVEQLIAIATQQASQLANLSAQLSALAASSGDAGPSNVQILTGADYSGFIIQGEAREELPPQNNLLMAYSEPEDDTGRLVLLTFTKSLTFTGFKQSGSNFVSDPASYAYAQDYGGLQDAKFSAVAPLLQGRTDVVGINFDSIDDSQVSFVLKTDVMPQADITLLCDIRLIGAAKDEATDPGNDGLWRDSEPWRDSAEWVDGATT